MKLADYVAEFLVRKGLRHAFVLTGGASVHLIDSIAKHPDIQHVCPQHEQASAMAADAYARVTENLGVAISTSGPGATNMLTGICSAYYDSIPVLYITGQVATFRSKQDTGVRQIGFQETDVVPMYRHVTNYAVKLEHASQIRYELEKACYMATEGRPGPVVIDIPDNLQRENVEPDALEQFTPPPRLPASDELDAQVARCVEMLARAKRPVVILGAGVRVAAARRLAEQFLQKTGFPFAPTWAMADFAPSDQPLYIGTFGTHGTRYANFAVQNADLIVAIGSRLDTKATGSPVETFAREAVKIVIDIDRNELNKFSRFNLHIDLLMHGDAQVVLQKLNAALSVCSVSDISAWKEQIARWKAKYPVCLPAYYAEEDVNPYVFVKTLSQLCREDDTLVIDTGCCVAWMMQAFDFKKNQRLFHDWNNTAMGWALPASIGASLAKDKAPLICMIGDGSLQMTLPELATLRRHALPIKLFLINNGGYSMIRQTQDQWLDSRYVASSVEGGLGEVDLREIAEAYGFPTVTISKNRDIRESVAAVLRSDGAVFCDVQIGAHHRVVPQAKFGRPNEDLEPVLDRDEFLENMIVRPI